MIVATFVLLLGAAALFFVRLLLGPSLTDRIMALDGLIICGSAALVTHAVDTGNGTFLPVVVVFTLAGFISTSIVARFIEGRGG